MVKDNSISSKILDIVVHITMFLVLIITLYPVLHVVAASFSSAEAYNRGVVTVFPIEPTIKAYETIFKAGTVTKGFVNSVIYTTVGTAINLVLTAAMAYGLSRRRLVFRNFFTFIVILPMYFSGGLIPSFLLVNSLGLYDTMWALILPGAISSWNLIVMRSFFSSIPAELEESAFIDGANDLIVFFRIILPVSKASLATIGLFYAVGHWNSWFSALIYLKGSAKYPLQMVLRQIVIRSEMLQEMARTGDITALEKMKEVGAASIKFATLSVSMLPMLIIYPFIQKHFVKGVMIGSIKG